MAEITKVTAPMIPPENLGSKNRPVSEQTFEINNPSRVNKPTHDNKVQDREAGGQALRDNLGRAMMQPLLRDVGELMYNVRKMVALVQMGISASDAMQGDEVKELLQELFTTPEELLATLQEQEEASVLFKGEAFHVLRDVLNRFEQYPRVKDALVQLLKAYDYNVNYKNSLKTILYNCENLLDYMFSQDRLQFASYLEGLMEMLLPEMLVDPEDPQNPELQQGQQGQPLLDAEGNPVLDARGEPVMDTMAESVSAKEKPVPMEQREAAQMLKNNLLPLLGEVVVKYHQNGRIRDIVMVVVHNIVRVDKGTPEALDEAVKDLVTELRKVANLPESFGSNLLQALDSSAQQAKSAQNQVMEKLCEIIAETLHSPSPSNAVALRQAESLLISLLQNQSAMMDILHFALPMQTEDDHLFAELFVDPDSDEGKGKPGGGQSRKLFLTVESENHGNLEMCFLQTGERVEFSLWCPEVLLAPMSGLKRTVADIMQLNGFTMSGFQVAELVQPQTIAQVFPRLLNRKVGIDVRV